MPKKVDDNDKQTVDQSTTVLFRERHQFSLSRLEELSRRLKSHPAPRDFRGLTIYAAGSFARGEASRHSDVDLFFLHNDDGKPIEDPRLKGIRVLAAVIREIEDGMEFPAPSNDGEFLNIIRLSEVLESMGGAEDDYKNHFTARMLLLLESTPVYGTQTYNAAIDKVLDSYFRDYEDHADDFRTTFLVNDILRFWKTLCLNYEHRRNQEPEARKVKQKIKNFKLKFSRLLTCFATVGLLASHNSIRKSDVARICKMRPIERLQKLAKRCPETSDPITKALEEYAWFLGKTNLSRARLETYFGDKDNRKEAFRHAHSFGSHMFEGVELAARSTGTLRYLVI